MCAVFVQFVQFKNSVCSVFVQCLCNLCSFSTVCVQCLCNLCSLRTVCVQCLFSVCAICAVSEQCVFSVQRYILFLPSSVQGQYPLPGSHTKKRNQKINWNIEWNMGANEFHPLLKWSIFVLSETGWIWFIGDILTYQTFFNGRPFLWSLRQPAFISDPPT